MTTQTASASFSSYKVGDLVWLPSGVELIYSDSVNLNYDNFFAGHPWKATYRKSPTYALIVETKPALAKVLIGEEQYYVHYRDIYGEKNDY